VFSSERVLVVSKNRRQAMSGNTFKIVVRLCQTSALFYEPLIRDSMQHVKQD